MCAARVSVSTSFPIWTALLVSCSSRTLQSTLNCSQIQRVWADPALSYGLVEYLRTLAVARLVLDNFDNLQASWVTQGGKVGQLSLAFGANDMGSVMIEENVVRAAGASYCMDEIEIVRNIENAGFAAKRRNMHYEILGEPIFRERNVPRMLELAVARADGDSSRPPEIVRYAARSAVEKKARREQPAE